jgi:hypothetical protein
VLALEGLRMPAQCVVRCIRRKEMTQKSIAHLAFLFAGRSLIFSKHAGIYESRRVLAISLKKVKNVIVIILVTFMTSNSKINSCVMWCKFFYFASANIRC